MLAPAAGHPILAVSVGTKVQSKDWGRDNWRALLNRLAALYPDHALALCGASEESEASEFAAEGWRANSRSPVVNLCGLLTPRESAAVFAQARVFVGHDSGPMHLAAAVQTPCVAIFAARNKPRVWFPYGKQHRVLYHQTDCWGCGLETCIIERKKCLTSITVERCHRGSRHPRLIVESDAWRRRCDDGLRRLSSRMLPELHSILNLLEGGFGQLKVLVIGDIMLDRYIHGDVERISPEAPVPVIRHARATSAPAARPTSP